ncbi:hypothetical protein [Lacibacter sp. H407]|uniref:hypothetical protein n=1 Tax=Lacibacter sp. H407 TaxID=3133423 RepID=UPI0030BC479C
MKVKITFALTLLLFVTVAGFAQLPKVSGGASIGNLVTQFTNAIKPTSFLSSWTGGKGNFLSTAGKVKDAVGVGKSIASLAGFLKPDMFKQGFNVQNLISTANTVKTMSAATGLLKNLEGGLKPEAFVSGWAGKRTGWLNALNLIK